MTDEDTRQDTDLVTIVERSMGGALTATLEATAPASTRTTSLPPALSSPALNWSVVPPDQERVLPGASITWTGHAPVVDPAADPVVRTVAADPGDPLGLLGRLPVGAGLVDVLARVEVADADDAALVDVAARWQEFISWATAMQSRAVGEIARRRTWTEEHNAAAAEISARLRIPQGEANKHMARGAGLAEHPQVMDALHDAVIDTAKADILLRSGNPLTIEERGQAITLYLPQAPDHTRRWLREKMNEFANGLKGTTETTKYAMTRRAVFLDPTDNSMAWISANLPATDAAAVWDAVEQAAHILRRTPGATRTLAQARADALVAITTGRIIVPPHPECTPTEAATTSSAGAAAPGTGTGEAAPGTTGTAMGASGADTRSAGAGSVSTDFSVNSSGSGSHATGEGDGAHGAPVLPRTTVAATGCSCGGCLCGGVAVRVIPVKPQIRVTVPATMLLGLDDAPGYLDGYGPIPAGLAARIATDATWQRLVTDPVTGILTDYSTTTYQPGKVLRQAVTARDRTCCFPQCDRPARWADLDHIHPFDHELDPTTEPPCAPGQTRASNLQPLCRAHHLAKTHHGWDVTRDPETGVTAWTAPTGHRYIRPPTETGHAHAGHVSNDITSLADDTRHRLGHHPPSHAQDRLLRGTGVNGERPDRSSAEDRTTGPITGAPATEGRATERRVADPATGHPAPQDLIITAQTATDQPRIPRTSALPSEPPF